MANIIKCYLWSVRALFQRVLCCQIPLKYIHRVNFPHPIGIVIGSDTQIGNNVTIYQNVTIGRKNLNTPSAEDYPIICDNVIIYSGAVIAGGLTVGENAIVGANAVVTSDVPNNTVVVGHNCILQRKQG